MDTNITWRDLPPTENQINAIKNKCKGFKLKTIYPTGKSKPSNRGEAYDMIKQLNSIIAHIKIVDRENQRKRWDYDDYPDNRMDDHMYF